MKHKLAALFFTATVSSASIIPVAGGGDLASIPSGSIYGWSLVLGGANETGSISLSLFYNGNSAMNPSGGFIGATSQGMNSNDRAVIDGVTFSSGFFAVTLGNGEGLVSGMDSERNVIASQPIAGSIVVTSETCEPLPITFGRHDCAGRYRVVPPTVANPEPSSWALAIVGLVVFIAAVRRK